ncbi:MAG: hypothetical protein R3353_00590 [Salegentibacter mishustinae]|nr:hypothetical protein [Salegentibacter mishustinae]
MSKILYVALKNDAVEKEQVNKIEAICSTINPNNIEPNPTKVFSKNKIIVGISNPVQSIEVKGVNVLLGQAFKKNEDWDVVGGSNPDGNYAIFRANDEKVEIVSDILGTRAVWYFKNEEIFIASTSQRAIVQYLNDFQFNDKVIPWFLSNGLLGPGLSWDKRFSLVPPDSSLVLNFKDWSCKIETREVKFKPNNKSDKENIETLHKTLESTFSELNLDYSKWNLTLSGGYDSRGNFCLLPKRDNKDKKLHTITWGFDESQNIKDNDAYVAKKLSRKYDLPHTFFSTDNPNEPLEVILDRFFKNGEGRIDHIGGYMDGFEIWKTLFDNKIRGVIRGDEVFGSYDFISSFHLRKFVGLTICSDYNDLEDFPYLKSFNQEIPKEFERKVNESNEIWRDRLYQSLYVPLILTSLADLKQGYVEQINPLLSKKIVTLIREMPDHLRTDKYAFRQIVNSLSPKVKFADRSASLSGKDIYKDERMVKIIRSELQAPLSKTIFSADFISSLLDKMVISESNINNKMTLLSTIKKLVPKTLKRKILKKTFTTKMEVNRLAFRAFIIVRMIRIFKEDTK